MTLLAAPTTSEYARTLRSYCSTRLEADLYLASLLGQRFVESGLGPDDIVALHTEALEIAVADLPLRQKAGAAVDALQFLLEVMIAYGVHHRQYLELRFTERTREAEAQALLQRQRAQQAQQADEEKSAILAAIVHELRTPLTAARGFVDLTQRGMERQDRSTLVNLLEEAKGALGRLERLCAGLAEASRGVPASLDLTIHPLGPLLARACNWARPAADAKQIALVECCEHAALRVYGDADALLSIFSNLLSSALRYTARGGTVTVQSAATPTEVVVSIVDTGIGMTPEVQVRIFEKFYRAPEAMAVEAGGLGLGLALTRQLVLAHGGRVEVESVLGSGSTFRVHLPFIKQKDEGD
jgi:signal transduction histidine kinase